MVSLSVSGIGALLAAVGGGVLLARCFREPRGDVIAWAVALLGLLVSLGSQALGHLTGFDSAMFRGMELGGQVIAPLALVLALSEVAARSAAVRFCARLYIPSLGLVAVVILSLDQLAQTTFTKAWPDPSVFYQLPPDYVLMFAIGPLTALVALTAAWTVLVRSGQPGWNAVLPAELMGGAAALALAYPCMAQLAAYLSGTHLPVGSLFAPVCAAAAVLGWLAADRAGRVRLSVLHGRSAAAEAGAHWGDRDDRDDWGDRGVYGGRGRYRLGQPAAAGARSARGDQDADGYGWQDDRQGGGSDWTPRDEYDDRYWGGSQEPDFATGDFATGDFATGGFAAEGFATGDLASGDFAAGDVAAGDFASGNVAAGDFASGNFPAGDFAGGGSAAREADPGYPASGRQAGSDWRGDSGRQAGSDWRDEGIHGPDKFSAMAAAADTDPADLFGQIAIYTLLEDRVKEFDQLTERVVEQVRSREPDTLVFIVHAVPSAPMQRILYEVYRDRTAYQRHLEQPYVKRFEADRRPFVLATNVIELGLQQAKVSAFPSVADLFGEPGYDTSGFERPDFLRDYGRTSGQAGDGEREFP